MPVSGRRLHGGGGGGARPARAAAAADGRIQLHHRWGPAAGDLKEYTLQVTSFACIYLIEVNCVIAVLGVNDYLKRILELYPFLRLGVARDFVYEI